MTSRHTLHLALFSLLLLAPATASADVVPMDVTECDMHTVGSACTDPAGGGVCTMSTCSRIDYTVDAGGHPGSTTYDCVRCVVGDAGASASDGGTTAPRPTSSCSASPGAASAYSLAAIGLALTLIVRRRR